MRATIPMLLVLAALTGCADGPVSASDHGRLDSSTFVAELPVTGADVTDEATGDDATRDAAEDTGSEDEATDTGDDTSGDTEDTGTSTEGASDTGTATGTDTDTSGEEDEDEAAEVPARTLYVDPVNDAAKQADHWRESHPEDASLMDKMGAQPLAFWVGDWMRDVTGKVDDAVTDGGEQLRTLVIYNIPLRDCGSWSEGGAADAEAYAKFIVEVAVGIDHRPAMVILEPDGLALTHCLNATQIAERQAMMASAVTVLSAAGAEVYIDAGKPGWVAAEDMAAALLAAGGAGGAGFALNVAHTDSTEDNVAYAEELRATLGSGAHYVIDTGRNGLGPDDDGEWCNPLGRALGANPTLSTGITGLDALLWVKSPGDSDGECNGGPPAGDWWAEYALGLVERSSG